MMIGRNLDSKLSYKPNARTHYGSRISPAPAYALL